MPTIAITSALLLNRAASANRACISPSRWRITFRWPAPVFWERLPAAEKVVLTDSASCDEVMPLIAQEKSDSRRPGSGAGAIMGAGQGVGRQRPFVAARHSGRRPGSTRRLLSRLSPPLTVPLQQVFGMAEGLLCFTRLDDPHATILHSQGRPLSLWMKSASLIKTRTTSRRAKPGNC